MRADAWFTGRARSYSGALGAVGSRRLIRTAPGSERRRAVRMSGRTSTAIRRGSGLPTRWRLARSPVLRGLTPGCLHRFREVVLKSADDHVEWIEPSPIAEGRSHHVNLSLYLAICDRDTLQHGALVICDRDVGDWVHGFPLSRLNFSAARDSPALVPNARWANCNHHRSLASRSERTRSRFADIPRQVSRLRDLLGGRSTIGDGCAR